MARPEASTDYSLKQSLRGGQGTFRDLAVDITREFAISARGLANGRVAATRDFRLFDSVGAIEIGDPKMDSGLLLPAEAEKPLYDVSKALSLREILHVFDIHMYYFMDWHQGMPLAQTMLASHYVDALLENYNKTIEFFKPVSPPWHNGITNREQWRCDVTHYMLTFFCIAITRLCGTAIDEIRNCEAPFYDDEDISLQTMGRDFFPLVTHTALWTFGQEVTGFVEHCKQVDRSALLDDDINVWRAIEHRISLLMSMIKMMDPCFNTDERLAAMRDAVTSIKMIRALDKIVPGHVVEGVFSPLIQHRLASTSPLRPLSIYDFDKSYDLLHHLAHGLELELTAVDHVLSLGTRYENKMYLRAFACRQRFALPYIRAMIYANFWEETKFHMDLELIAEIAQFVPNEALLRYTSPTTKPLSTEQYDIMQRYAQEIVKKFYLSYHRALCSNASRMRRLLCHCLSNLRKLHQMAVEMDNIMGTMVTSAFTSPVAFWCELTCLDIELQIVQLGFQLGVYLEHEYMPLYGYLSSLRMVRDETITSVIQLLKSAPNLNPCDQTCLESLAALVDASHADGVMVQAVYTMHVMVTNLDPRPSMLSPAVQQRRWDIRMRPFWQSGHAVAPWDELQHRTKLFRADTPDDDKVRDVRSELQAIRARFTMAIELYNMALDDRYRHRPFLQRATEDEYYPQKILLAKKAILELEQIEDAVNKGLPISIHKSKIAVTTSFGARIPYVIPGLAETKSTTLHPAAEA